MFKGEDVRVHEGHRGRMRDKLRLHGPRIFDTYELLEMLLYYVIPYKDTNPIAKRLLERFSSLDGVLDASREELELVSGIGASAAKFISLAGRLTKEKSFFSACKLTPIFSDYDDTGRFFVQYFRENTDTHILLLLLDDSMRLLGMEKIEGENFGSAKIKVKSFIDPAIRHSSTVAIVANCHRYGSGFPTEAERVTSKMIKDGLAQIGVKLAEHYIVCADRFCGVSSPFSFKLNSTSPELELFLSGKRMQQTGERMDDSDVESLLVSLLTFATNEERARIATESMLNKYGSLALICECAPEELCSCERLTASAALLMRLLGGIASRRITDSLTPGTNPTRCELEKYMIGLFMGGGVETVYMLTFDERGRFLSCEFVGEGTPSSSDVYPRRLLERAILRSAKSVIIAHNHPKGAAEPSEDDLFTTGLLSEVFYNAGIALLSHYIVAAGDVYRINGYLRGGDPC